MLYPGFHPGRPSISSRSISLPDLLGSSLKPAALTAAGSSRSIARHWRYVRKLKGA